MRQRRYLRNLVNSTHSSMQIEYKMKSQQKWVWCERRRWNSFRKRQGHKQIQRWTHFFVVFDFVLRDDAVGLVGLLPGELDAALLHFLLDDLADLGRSCLDKSMSISAGQTLSAHTHTHTNQLTTLHPLTNIHGDKISITVQTVEDSVSPTGAKLQHADYKWQFSSINSNISSRTSRHLLSLMTELFRKPLKGRGLYL